MRNTQGFTLIEMSIVLVIVGLVVGGIIAGTEMIRAAEIRAIGSDLERFRTTIHNFKLKYDCLPGDCAHATRLFGQSATCPAADATGTCNGNGDENYLPWPNESFLFIDHMRRAEFFGTGYYLQIPVRGVRNRGGVYIGTNDLYGATSGRYGNTLSVSSWNGDCLNGEVISAIDLSTLDKKSDDGMPTSGNLYGIDASPYGAAGGGCEPLGPACVTGTDYSINNDAAICRMIAWL